MVGIPGRVVVQDGVKIKKDLKHNELPDPVADRLNSMQQEIDALRSEVEQLRKEGARMYEHSDI